MKFKFEYPKCKTGLIKIEMNHKNQWRMCGDPKFREIHEKYQFDLEFDSHNKCGLIITRTGEYKGSIVCE